MRVTSRWKTRSLARRLKQWRSGIELESKGTADGLAAAVEQDQLRGIWDFKLFQGSLGNGVMATAGGVLFAASREGNFIALDAKTGRFSGVTKQTAT